MRNNVPISQQFDAFELESRGIREFFKIEFADGAVMNITPHNNCIFLDKEWEGLPCKISENAQNSGGEMSRPKFAVVNPQGMFSLWVESGYTDGAILTRYQVLISDLEAGVNAYTKNVWVMSKVVSLNKEMVIFECRSTIDGANFDLPARAFYPPDFPHVTLR